jgi:hypothetical protein
MRHAPVAAAAAAEALVPMGCVYRAVAVPSLEPPYDCIHFRVRHKTRRHFA